MKQRIKESVKQASTIVLGVVSIVQMMKPKILMELLRTKRKNVKLKAANISRPLENTKKKGKHIKV
jgi:hypothetical protein